MSSESFTQQILSNQTREFFRQLQEVLSKTDVSIYTYTGHFLEGASIGKHCRHILELFEALIAGYENGAVCYDARKRDEQLEQDLGFALEKIKSIHQNLPPDDKPLQVVILNADEDRASISSTYYREWYYNLEHMIHHMALIRVGLREQQITDIPESFGVAPATMKYRREQVLQ